MEIKQVKFPLPNFSFFFFFFFYICCTATAEEVEQGGDSGSYKLFVFGDSYADTGNWPKSTGTVAWKEPYGMTFPGEPSGRFSDGRVLTDYLASFLGIKCPLTLREWREFGEKSQLNHGMNLAHGGTGVFNTMVNQPNMTTQINFFQQLVEEEDVYDRKDLMTSSSIALVSAAGNDYATYLATNGAIKDLPTFTNSIMSQLELNLQRIHGLGVQKVGITSLEPMGCLPLMTAKTNYTNCTEAGNTIANLHNQNLQQIVEKLNNQTGSPVFQILDIYKAFMTALDMENNNPTGNTEIENPVLKPCCIGTGRGYSCGSTNNLGLKKYILCENPKFSFFWDEIHPSQEGWFSIYSALKPSLQNFLS